MTFISYSRTDAKFALTLAKQLKVSGAGVWLDENIVPGSRWDRAVQTALESCDKVVVILSPAAVESENVLDEINFAIDRGTAIVPVLLRSCDVPFRLRRLQYIDCRAHQDYLPPELLHLVLRSGTASASGAALPGPLRPVTPSVDSHVWHVAIAPSPFSCRIVTCVKEVMFWSFRDAYAFVRSTNSGEKTLICVATEKRADALVKRLQSSRASACSKRGGVRDLYDVRLGIGVPEGPARLAIVLSRIMGIALADALKFVKQRPTQRRTQSCHRG